MTVNNNNNSKYSINCIIWNCGGITKKTKSSVEKIKHLQNTINKNFDILCLVETHVNKKTPPTELIEDYKITHNVIISEDENEKYSGIIIIINKMYNINKINDIRPGRVCNIILENPGTNKILNLTAIYGYSGQAEKNANLILKDIGQSLKNSQTESKILLGDFNFIEEQIDTKSKNTMTNQNLELAKSFENIKKITNIDDCFRLKNPNLIRYTYSKGIAIRTRIDRCYATPDLTEHPIKTRFLPSLGDKDHKILCTSFSSEIEMGPGQWKLNTSILKDKAYIKLISDKIELFKLQKKKFLETKNWMH